MKLFNPNPATGEGEILVRGSNVMVGYYKEPELTAEMFIDGWLRTGDLGTIDENGYVEIKGRNKNMILSASGENIYPEEIEDVINKHEFVLESMVYEMKGKLVAKVHLNKEVVENYYNDLKHSAKDWQHNAEEKSKRIMDDIMHHVNSKVARFSKLNSVVEQHEPFEKTPTQKIKRFIYNK
jgi:long-chain acyl-CoA synthetase